MTKYQKTFAEVLRGTSDNNIRFQDLCSLLKNLGFDERVKGSHRIYWRDGVEEIVNIQPLPDGKAKAYQVRQIRQIIQRYGIGEEE